jgi:predicted DNA binding CopG/RHH family protein
MAAKKHKRPTDEAYYERHGILDVILDEDVDLGLDEALREDILKRKRKRTMKNISIKIDPLYLQAIKKIAVKKGIPYQTLLRQWVAEEIKKELKIA